MVGTPAEDQRRWLQIALEANDAALAVISPGIEAADVCEAGIGLFERERLLGYNQINIVGHGTGVVVCTSDVVLREGVALCVEPAIVGMEGPDRHKGCFIVEDIVHVTEQGHKNLTTSPSTDLWIQPVRRGAVRSASRSGDQLVGDPHHCVSALLSDEHTYVVPPIVDEDPRVSGVRRLACD